MKVLLQIYSIENAEIKNGSGFIPLKRLKGYRAEYLFR